MGRKDVIVSIFKDMRVGGTQTLTPSQVYDFYRFAHDKFPGVAGTLEGCITAVRHAMDDEFDDGIEPSTDGGMTEEMFVEFASTMLLNVLDHQFIAFGEAATTDRNLMKGRHEDTVTEELVGGLRSELRSMFLELQSFEFEMAAGTKLKRGYLPDRFQQFSPLGHLAASFASAATVATDQAARRKFEIELITALCGQRL